MDCNIWNLFSILVQLLLSAIALAILLSLLKSEARVRTTKTPLAHFYSRCIQANIFRCDRPYTESHIFCFPARQCKFKRLRLVLRFLRH